MTRPLDGTDGKYTLVCSACGSCLPPSTSHCPDCLDALLRTDYTSKEFAPLDRSDIFRFLDWLPIEQPVDTAVGPIVYRSQVLAERLGLELLYIGFNGYAPEIGAHNATGSFKDYEALPTLLKMREQGRTTAVLASVGNSARAFAHAAITIGFPITIVAPESSLPRLWLPMEPTDDVRLIVLEGSSDYASAIRIAAVLAERAGLPYEGGARNVARRDGMGTVVLEHVRETGGLPQHYIQAISSGTGGIAAWEAAMRLIDTERFGDRLPTLHLAQNAPFTPIHDAWSSGHTIRPDEDTRGQLERIDALTADVLANRNPPYAIPGGVFDALSATSGHTYAVANDEIADAQMLFADTEGLPIGPESGAALAALQQALVAGSVRSSESVLLNVTGNNDALLKRDFDLRPIPPWQTLRPGDAEGDGLRRWIDRITDTKA